MSCPSVATGGRPRWGAVVRGVAFAGLFAVVSLRNARAGDPASRPGDDLTLPGDAAGGEIVQPYGTNVPGECERFLDACGRDWVVVWDRTLETPRFVFPASPWRLSEADGAPTEKTPGSALSFVDANAEFFGISSQDLGEVELLPLDDGYLLTALQMHPDFPDLPVRGTYFRMRLNAAFRLRSVASRVARDLPGIEPPLLGEEDAEDLARADGFEEQFSRTLALVFPADAEQPVASWVVRVTLPEDEEELGVETGMEMEVFYSAVSGERLATVSTLLGVNGRTCEPLPGEPFQATGVLWGIAPDPGDMHASPAPSAANDVYELPGAQLEFTACDADCNEISVEMESDLDGRWNLSFDSLNPGQPPVLTVRLFQVEFPAATLPDFHCRGEIVLNDRAHVFDFNPRGNESENFHLMAYHQLRRARLQIVEQIREHGLLADPESFPRPKVTIQRLSLGSFYRPAGQVIGLFSDEVTERERDGRWRKIVPTVIHHEFGHHVIEVLSGGSRDPRVAEGVSDALAGYISRVSTFGYIDDEGELVPTAIEMARDLAADRRAWSGLDDDDDHGRRVVAGALWELWAETLDDPPADPDGDEGRVSSFAYGVVLRWLRSLATPPAGGPLRVEYSPMLGLPFLVEADHPKFNGNQHLADGIPHEEEVLRAFGRRNLFPHAFVRGDANGDGGTDVSDAITILAYLFLGGEEPDCPDAFDTDDTGVVDVSDAVFFLNHLFLGARRLPAPYPWCGWDLSAADGLGCWSSPCVYFPTP
ncbi:MAG: dockerin type I repeat-containing protein [Planctomycetota bacterium]|nr:dockerin type I repeat-containing protein [Planctomycetota bacterium]